MKKSNKKGFTIVELVIVIAVIAILAAVLIPTFSNVVTNAKKSAAMQNARNAYENYLADHATDEGGVAGINLCIASGDYYFHVEAGEFKPAAEEKTGHNDEGKNLEVATIENGNLKIATTNP